MYPFNRNADYSGEDRVISQCAHLATQVSTIEYQAQDQHQDDSGWHAPKKDIGQDQTRRSDQYFLRHQDTLIEQIEAIDEQENRVTEYQSDGKRRQDHAISRKIKACQWTIDDPVSQKRYQCRDEKCQTQNDWHTG